MGVTTRLLVPSHWANSMQRVGEAEAFCGDRALQISRREIDFQGCDPVICLKTALAAFDAIVNQGEGASAHNDESHFARFVAIRAELARLLTEGSKPEARRAKPRPRRTA